MKREEAIAVYNGLISTKIKEAFEFFAPELREINDEEIRKDIIGGLMWQRDNLKSEGPHDNNLILPGFCLTVGKHLSYLEKQKDLDKMIVVSPEVWDKAINDAYENGKKEGEKQKEQKPWKVGANAYFTPEPKPAEWSEEDGAKLGALINYFEGDALDYLTDDIVDWLKSLRPQPHKEIYQAAKRDLAIKFMNYLDENRPAGKMSLSNGECEDIDKAFKENDWAKIIRYIEKYQPHWKPSEEQMEILGRFNDPVLKSLHSDLENYFGL